MQNATSVRQIDSPHEAAPSLLDRLLQRQRLLAWSMTVGTVLITATFFALLSRNDLLLRRVVYGHTVTVANLAAVAIILVMLASVTVFGWYAQRIDAHLDRRSRE